MVNHQLSYEVYAVLKCDNHTVADKYNGIGGNNIFSLTSSPKGEPTQSDDPLL